MYATITFHPSRTLHKQILDIFSQEVELIKQTPGFTASVVVSALHINAIKAMKVRGGNALGVESDESLDSRCSCSIHEALLITTVGLLTLGWSNAEDDEAIYAVADSWVQQSETAASEMGLLHPWRYINYASPHQDPFSGYGEANKIRLQNIQKSVDPAGIFSSTGLCRGSFKLL